jgi:hypothetical protein
MGSPNHSLLRWFRGGNSPVASGLRPVFPRIARRSTGLGDFMSGLKPIGPEKLRILDLGPTSPGNITFLTEMGMHVYNEDVLHAAHDTAYKIRQKDAPEQIDLARFFRENLDYPQGRFDAILCWDIFDYLPEMLVNPIMERIASVLRLHGSLLAFFHTRDVGPDLPYHRYHLTKADTLELEPRPGFRLQRIFQNRHLENLFRDFASRKFFLGRDNLREVIVVR